MPEVVNALQIGTNRRAAIVPMSRAHPVESLESKHLPSLQVIQTSATKSPVVASSNGFGIDEGGAFHQSDDAFGQVSIARTNSAP